MKIEDSKKDQFKQKYRAFLTHKYPSNISSLYDIIYVQIPRCGGSVVKDAIGGFSKENSFLPASAIPQFAFDNYSSIAFVRNPYDRCVSAYFHLLTGGDNTAQDMYDKTKFLSPYHSFEDFILNGLELAAVEQQMFIHQYRFLDRGISFICKYEDLQKEYFKIRKKLKLKNSENLKNSDRFFKKNNISLYSKEMRNKIEQVYEKDFKEFKYLMIN